MPKSRTGSVLLSVACLAAACGTGKGADAKSPRLLLVLADASSDSSGKLAQCEKLTLDEYRKRGVEVIELEPAAFEQWLAGEGQAHQKAQKHFQHLALAKAKHADAIGGLTSMVIDAEQAKEWQAQPGTYFYGWGISLTGITSNFTIELREPGKVRAIPLGLGELGSWEIPVSISPTSCSSGHPAREMMRPAGQPMVGLGLDGNKINRVVPNSPASEIGLREGDILSTFNGRAIGDNTNLREAMSGKAAGDEVEVSYTREGHANSAKLKLADRAAIEKKNSPVGRALPGLLGKDVNGKEVRPSDYKGKVIVLDFWATWCGPCLEDLPLQQLTYERLKDKGVEWIAVSIDDDETAWRDFVKSNKLGGVQIRDPDWAEKLNVGSFPTVLLVDRSGLVACESHGASTPRQAAFLAAQ